MYLFQLLPIDTYRDHSKADWSRALVSPQSPSPESTVNHIKVAKDKKVIEVSKKPNVGS